MLKPCEAVVRAANLNYDCGQLMQGSSTALPPIMVSVPLMVTPSRSNKSKCHGEENMK